MNGKTDVGFSAVQVPYQGAETFPLLGRSYIVKTLPTNDSVRRES
jgi:hypothetical protein